MSVRAGGRAAVTHWEVLERYSGADGAPVASLLACRLETGRTHQIRVHLASIGHPLIGDAVYGAGFRTKANQLAPKPRAAVAALGRQALHAYLLGIEHRAGQQVPLGTAGRSSLFTPQPRLPGPSTWGRKPTNQRLRRTRRSRRRDAEFTSFRARLSCNVRLRSAFASQHGERRRLGGAAVSAPPAG